MGAGQFLAALMIVEIEVPSQARRRFMEVGALTQADLFVFHAAQQTLDEDARICDSAKAKLRFAPC